MIKSAEGTRFRIIVDTMAVMVAVALLMSGWALYTRFSDSNAARSNNARVWHAVICSIEQATLKNKSLSPTKKAQSIQFFDRLLTTDVGTTGCGIQLRTP